MDYVSHDGLNGQITDGGVINPYGQGPDTNWSLDADGGGDYTACNGLTGPADWGSFGMGTNIVEYSTSYRDCPSQLGMAYTPCACNSFFMADGNPTYNYLDMECRC